MPISKEEKKTVNKIIKELTTKIESLRPSILKRAEAILGKEMTIHSLHGMIGGKNNEYADCVSTQYATPDEFISKWLEGFIETEGDDWWSGGHPLFHLLKDEYFEQYLMLFLERNFYRNYEERTREKPIESLWSCWFGDRDIYWGLLISPVKRSGQWKNDVSEIRKAEFSYWTIGHVMSTGLVDIENDELYEFDSIEELYKFIKNILKRLKRSQYEKELYDRYIDYLKSSENIMEEPFLIPELRWGGADKKHKYRLDFTILNPHNMKFVGFEISPQSSHMSVKGTKSGKQIEWNNDLKLQWGKEMRKRNDYFGDFGITTITFTDNELEDLDVCFEKVEEYLNMRGKKKKSVKALLNQIEIIANDRE